MRWTRHLSWIVLAGITASVVGMLAVVMYRQGVSAHESEMQQTQITALEAGLGEANERLAAQGVPTVAVPDVDTTAPAPVITVPPTDAQMLSVVAECFDVGRCEAPAGEAGKDATAPTPDALRAAVAACVDSGECVLPPGPPGKDGANGADGAKGDTALPTPEQIAAAVQAYCSTGACVGPPGEAATACPEGWALTETAVVTRYGDGNQLTPAMLCTPTPTPTPTP